MRYAKILAPVLAAGALTALGGCQTIGPKAIAMGRDRYNSIIQTTSMQQTMANIVRVYNYEPPMFMDVTEVDAVLSAGASVTGTRSGLGGLPTANVGSVGGAAQYSETPTIRYQPLLGQALVAQLVTPVSVDALGLLYDSSWDIAPLLDFSSAYLTLDYQEFYSALNTMIELWRQGALEFGPGKSHLADASAPETASPKPGGGAGQAGSTKTNNDSLVIYLRPFGQGREASDIANKQRALQLWVRMFRIYADGQPPYSAPPGCAALGLSMDSAKLRDWDVNIASHISGSDETKGQLLDSARACLPSAIELRVVPASELPASMANNATRAPLMRTYSALGILKNATDRTQPKIEFVTAETYRQIRGDSWNGDDASLSYYTLLPGELDSVNCSDAQKRKGGCETPVPPERKERFNNEIDRWIRNAENSPGDNHPSGLDVYETKGKDALDKAFIDLNGRLGTLRRYILIIVDDHLPGNSVYVAHSDGEKWYYIAKDDTVSAKNFQLLSLFMTMMAVPPATQPLSPVINVGG
jgi:hypothetical protein